MASNNDNAMTRFLFAILRQKNLKDIDWNKVAHDPILAAEITNGHAARMRYSRFKSAMLGLEPTRRNRTGPPKSRTAKNKKDKNKKDDAVKSECGTPVTPTEETPDPSSTEVATPAAPPKIKQETTQYAYNNRLTPALTPGPVSMPQTAISSTMPPSRFLTPSGDTDKYSPTSVMTPGGGLGDMMHSHGQFDYQGTPCPEQFDLPWGHATSHFAAAYPFDEYATPCEHGHFPNALHSQCQMGLPAQSVETDIELANVKREDCFRYD